MEIQALKQIPICYEGPETKQREDEKQKSLPSGHPLEGNLEAQNAFKALTKKLRVRFPQMYPSVGHIKEIETGLQPEVEFVPDLLTFETKEDRKLLAQLGRGNRPLRDSLFVEKEMLTLLVDLVRINSQSSQKEGNKKVRERMAKELKEIGFKIEHDPSSGVLLATQRPKKYVGKKVLLIGHTDTVLAPKAFPKVLCRENNGYVRGSGVADMKGGLVVMMTALKALHRSGLLQDRYMTVLINSDEETGSTHSRSFISKEAREHDIGFGFESGKLLNAKGGGLTVGRKGILAIDIDIYGRSAHSGVAPHEGMDAGRIAGRVSEYLSAMTDYSKGITANVGVIRTNPESARNRVLWSVKMEAEIRYWKLEEREELERNVRLFIQGAVACHSFGGMDPICSEVDVRFSGNPPAPVTKEQINWFQKIYTLSGYINFHVKPVTSGGASDQNWAREAGLTMIDSFGPVGVGLHSEDEKMFWDTFLPRAQLVALAIQRTRE